MTRVDFYILADQSVDAGARFACRLSLRALAAGNQVHIHTDDAAAASAIDELMWDYPKHRFLPHCVLEAKKSSADLISNTPIHIGCNEPHYDEGVLINLSDHVPTFFGRFDRVAEVVVGDTKEQGRQHYQHYRSRGFPLYHHEMNDWEKSA